MTHETTTDTVGGTVNDDVAPLGASGSEPDSLSPADRAQEERVSLSVGSWLGAPGVDTPQGAVAVAPTASAASASPVPVRAAKRAANPPTSSNLGDRIFNGLTALFAGLIVAILGIMLVLLFVQSLPLFRHSGFSFFTSSTWDPIHDIYGAVPAILGTLYTSLVAIVLAGIVGILVAIFLSEIAPHRLRFPLGFVIELLGAVPSIVYGLWALFVLVPIVRTTIEPALTDHFGFIPLFTGYPIGLGVFSASLILAIMILPTIAAISRDVLMGVPDSQREAMLALGATRWETTWKVVIPYARSGIIGAILLALGRAVGETMAVQMVIGNTQSISLSLFNFGTTMPATIVNQFTEANGDVYRSALIAMALILMVVTLLLNALARLLVWSVSRKAGSL